MSVNVNVIIKDIESKLSCLDLLEDEEWENGEGENGEGEGELGEGEGGERGDGSWLHLYIHPPSGVFFYF